MKIIGHRGAASLALENTLESIQAAKKAGVDAIEFDVRMTADLHFVLSHDATLEKVSGHDLPIIGAMLAELFEVTLYNGEKIATLQQALQVAGDTPLMVELKGSGWAQPLATMFHALEPQNVSVIAIDAKELDNFHKLLPDMPVYLIQQFNPIDLFYALQTARNCGFRGIDFNFWLLGPLTYWLARRYKLEVVVYTVNRPWMARFLAKLYPDISISTDCPQDMQFLRDKAARRK